MPEIENTGANVAEPAAPQTDVNTQAADTGASNSDNGTPAPATQGNGQQSTQQPQRDLQHDAIAAQARREAEAQLAEARQNYEHKLELIRTCASYGCLSDDDVAEKFGLQGFNTLEELAAEAEREMQIQRTGIDPIAVDTAVKNSPAYKELEAAKQRTEVEGLYKEFKENFPDVDFDISWLDKGTEFANFVQKGLTFSQAYSLVNGKAIQKKATESARQQALNELGSKGHIQPTGNGADTSNVTVPAETMRYYKQLFPKWTEEQIKKDYAKSLKEGF